MKKCTLNYFKYNQNQINFKNGINYIIGPNASGKTTIIKLIQYALGLNNIPFENIINSPVEIEFSLDDNKYHFYRESDSNTIIVKSGDSSYEYNSRTNNYYDFLIEIFKPNCELTENKQIKYLINEIFFSYEIKNRFSSNFLPYLMLGVDKKFENVIQKKINILSNSLQEKEKNLNVLSNYKNDVLNEIDMDTKNKIQPIMNGIFEDYKIKQLSEYDLLNKSKKLLYGLKSENKYKIENILEYLDFLYSKNNMTQNKYLFDDVKNIIFKKTDFSSGSEKAYNELSSKLLLQSGYSKTNGIGLLFNDYSLNLDNETQHHIREIAERLSNDTGLQYIELTQVHHNIENDQIVYQLGSRYGKK